MQVADLRPDVAAEVANLPNPVIDRVLVEATRALCEAAPIWRDTFTLSATPGTHNLEIGYREIDGVPAEIFRAALPNAYQTRIETPPESVPGEVVRLQSLTCHGRPFHHYHLRDPRTLVIERSPPQTLAVTVSRRPVRNALTLPTVAASDYHDALIHGALYRVLRMHAQPWSDPKLAQWHAREFAAATRQAKAAAERGFEASAPRVAPRSFAAFHRW